MNRIERDVEDLRGRIKRLEEELHALKMGPNPHCPVYVPYIPYVPAPVYPQLWRPIWYTTSGSCPTVTYTNGNSTTSRSTYYLGAN